MCGNLVYPKMEDMFLEVSSMYGSKGSLMYKETQSGTPMVEWFCSGKDAAYIIDRIKKHLVIKGTHAERMLDLYEKYRGYGCVVEDPQAFKDYVKDSRDNTGPTSPRDILSRAWLAGYIDADGHLFTEMNGKYVTSGIEFDSNVRDHAAFDLLTKTFGGACTYGDRNDIRWRRGFGLRTLAFTKNFLVPIISHLRVKKWDAEQILARLNRKRPQRLNERTPKGEVIVQHSV